MVVHPSTAQATVHTAEVHDIYRRMLRSAGARGRFVRRPSGRRVHVVELGRGEVVVHLHGTNTSALSHLMLAERMGSTRSYLVDRPGCGLSDPPDLGQRWRFRTDAVRFVDEVLDALEVEVTTLVGASGGGIWATWYALERPERVRSLVMLGSVPALPGVRVPLPLRAMVTPVVGDVLARGLKPGPRMLRRMMSSMGEGDTIGQHPELFESLVAGARDPVAIDANRAELRALMSPRGFRAAMRIPPEELRRLTVPTLMIWGDHDPVVPLTHARAAAASIADVRLEVLPAGHAPQLGNPRKVADLLEQFTRDPTGAETEGRQ
jgi:pimeloyl-ACP methyl ester carboxylesterase